MGRARFIDHKLGERLRQQFVIDNRASAGGIAGAEIVANAPPDGQTLYVTGVNTQVSAPLLFMKISFDPLKDFDRFQRAEIVKWSKVIREAKLQPQ